MKKLTPRQVNDKREKEGLPRINFKVFKKIIRQFEKDPDSYEQLTYIDDSSRSLCGTEGCIGGWGAIFSGLYTVGGLKRRVLHSTFPTDRVAEAMGLTLSEAYSLFNGDGFCWPQPWGRRFAKTRTRKGEARVAIQYLTYIVNTGRIY